MNGEQVDALRETYCGNPTEGNWQAYTDAFFAWIAEINARCDARGLPEKRKRCENNR